MVSPSASSKEGSTLFFFLDTSPVWRESRMSTSGSEPMAVSLKPFHFRLLRHPHSVSNALGPIRLLLRFSNVALFPDVVVSFDLFSASSVSALGIVPSILRASLVLGGNTPSDCQLLGGVWKLDHPPNAELLPGRPLRSVSPSRPPRFPSATGLGVSPPASSPRSHSSAGTGGSSWSGVRFGNPAGRRARRRRSSRSLSDQNGFGSTDLVLLNAMLQQRRVHWAHNLQAGQAGFLFTWS